MHGHNSCWRFVAQQLQLGYTWPTGKNVGQSAPELATDYKSPSVYYRLTFNMLAYIYGL